MKNKYIGIKRSKPKINSIAILLDMAAEEYNAFFYSLVSTVSDYGSQVGTTQLDPHHKWVSGLGSCEICTQPSFGWISLICSVTF